MTDQRPTVQLEDGFLTISWDAGDSSRFHYLWLRDNCPQLLHSTTGHRIVETSTIPADVRPALAEITDAGDLRVEWEDGHVSTFPARWLRDHDYSNGVRAQLTPLVLWDAGMVDEIPTASYPALLADPAIRSSFLDGFVRYGLGILHDVPCEPGTVLKVAAEFGEVRSTSWGTVFDVVSMEDANSVAYTNLPLVTHTDEGYRDPAPTIQLQHFLRSDATGGESTLVDGFRLADDLRRSDPAAFEILANTPLHFHFSDVSAEHEAYLPVIDVDGDGNVRAVRFSNHSVTPFLLPFESMEAYYHAYRLLGTMRESEQYQLRIPMGAGDLYMVDNRRVMHGRTGFSSGGARHLQSCYIERDELVSRLAVANRGAHAR